MSKPFYEILIRCNNGVFAGGSCRATPDAAAAKVHLAEWPEVCATINVATLARVEELELELAAEKAARAAESEATKTYKASAESALATAKGAIENPALGPEETLSVVARVVADISKPVALRELEALEAEAAQLEAKRAALLATIQA